MNKSESLKCLNTWANLVRHSLNPLAYDALKNGRKDAARHGLAAVRAVRFLASKLCDYPGNCCFLYFQNRDEYIAYTELVRESRLAFRCALRAVGIQGAL